MRSGAVPPQLGKKGDDSMPETVKPTKNPTKKALNVRTIWLPPRAADSRIYILRL